MEQPGATVIAYGSLMSAYGITRHGSLRPSAVSRVQLHNARRGFGKASLHGDRFAMVLEPIAAAAPIHATALTGNESGAAPQALALDIDARELPALAVREGYSPQAFSALYEIGVAECGDVAIYLAGLLNDSAGDFPQYRRRLWARIGYTSPHYIPHPIAIGGRWGIIFLAAGAEGSGAADVVPVRVQSGCCELMTVAEVWQRKANESQLDYIAMCLLATAHRIRIDDLTGDMPEELSEFLRDRIAAIAPEGESMRRLLASA